MTPMGPLRIAPPITSAVNTSDSVKTYCICGFTNGAMSPSASAPTGAQAASGGHAAVQVPSARRLASDGAKGSRKRGSVTDQNRASPAARVAGAAGTGAGAPGEAAGAGDPRATAGAGGVPAPDAGAGAGEGSGRSVTP